MGHPKKLHLPAHGVHSDDEHIRELLTGVEKSLGFVPNMFAYMANAPHLLESYLSGYDRFRNESGFTPAEQEVVLLTISRENGCHYCVAAHSFLADTASQVPVEVTDAIRDGREVPNAKLGALSEFSRAMVKKRGEVDDWEIRAFLDTDYGEKHILDVLLAVSVKTISNYANHLFSTPVDEVFQSRAWKG